MMIAVTLFISCGEMNTVFSSGNSSYQVNAYLISPRSAEDTSTRVAFAFPQKLQNYSIVKNGDRIRPAFMNLISHDPDLTGLQVYMEDSAGNRIDQGVHYSLHRDAPENLGKLVTISNFNDDFPDFLLPLNLDAGQYTLFFNVLSGEDVLYQSTQTMYYIADLAFSLDSIGTYMPSIYEKAQLISPDTTILLEAEITADEGLDPYIIWYNGEKVIGEGRLSERYHHLLWTVPAAESFPKIKAEVFPFLVGNKPARATKGLEKGLTLGVNSKAVLPQNTEEMNGDAVYWYQFAGNVEPEKQSLRNDAILVKTQENPPRWEPLSGIYGLVIGEDDTYTVPDFSVILDQESETEYDLYSLHMRFSPQNEGTLFRGQFDTADSDLSSLSLEVLFENEAIVLSVQSGPTIFVKSIPADLFSHKRFVVTVLQFYAFQHEFFARLDLQAPLFSTDTIVIRYKGTLKGEGELQLGADENPANGIFADEDIMARSTDVAIIDEFFLGHHRVSLSR